MKANEIEKDGQIYRLKKPLYHQGLFWSTIIAIVLSAFLAVLLLVSVLTATSLEEENEQLTRLTGVSPYNPNRSYHDFAIGVGVEAEGEKVTVHSIKSDPGRPMTDEATGKAVLVSLTVENVGRSSLLLNPYSFDLVNEEGDIYILDSSTFDKIGVGTNVKPGEKVSFDLVFDGEAEEETNYALVHKDNRWGKEKKTTR